MRKLNDWVGEIMGEMFLRVGGEGEDPEHFKRVTKHMRTSRKSVCSREWKRSDEIEFFY